ncbi:MAG: hypothetical protein HC902_05565, partial [Calothrix sp. SM1_5_4]|nr:hypothetical protein [Calothrix sp. SM1_5_4]
MSQNSQDGALQEYFSECSELTQRVSEHLQALERGEYSADLIDSIYRDIHTIKGSSQLFGFKPIAEITHVMESSLDPIRKSGGVPERRLIQALFRCLDAVEEIVSAVQSGGSVDERSYQGVIVAVLEASLPADTAPLAKDHAPVLSEESLAAR